MIITQRHKVDSDEHKFVSLRVGQNEKTNSAPISS